MSKTSETSIQATSEDASTSKKYAVQKGYWKDPFISAMVNGLIQRKQPEISRGYYARTEAIWQTLRNFMRISHNNCQIISLGAGLDTTFWRLHEASMLPKAYVEVDFPDIVAKKARCISSKEPLRSRIEGFRPSRDSPVVHTKYYHLISADLRNIPELDQQIMTCNLDISLPTLILAECVLIYMEPDQSKNIIKWSSEKFPQSVFVNYEQLSMDDSFGKVMVANLKARQCILAGATVCTTKRSQEDRFLECDFKEAWCRDMWIVYNRIPDRKRIESIEMLDEIELLHQLLEHYCLVVAVKDPSMFDLSELSAMR